MRDKKILYRNDILLAVGILTAVLIGTWLYARQAQRETQAVVYVNGEQTASYLLAEETDVNINGTNRLVIQDGKAKMQEANCPDKLCVKQHAISRGGESITCLPNRIVVMIEGTKEDSVDAQVY